MVHTEYQVVAYLDCQNRNLARVFQQVLQKTKVELRHSMLFFLVLLQVAGLVFHYRVLSHVVQLGLHSCQKTGTCRCGVESHLQLLGHLADSLSVNLLTEGWMVLKFPKADRSQIIPGTSQKTVHVGYPGYGFRFNQGYLRRAAPFALLQHARRFSAIPEHAWLAALPFNRNSAGLFQQSSSDGLRIITLNKGFTGCCAKFQRGSKTISFRAIACGLISHN
eukprot:s4711_g1.t1